MIKKSNNAHLNRAKGAKKDEFYTQYEDVEKELKHYKEHFKGKVVYCNCDDPRESNFAKYFKYNFAELELKELIVSGFNIKKENTKNEFLHYYLENGEINGDYYPYIYKLDGDFRSQASIEFLKQADIVVTNPPFSIFKEYVDQLFEYDKKFLIVGSLITVTKLNIFNKIKVNAVWLGYNGGAFNFRVPSHYGKDLTIVKEDIDSLIRKPMGPLCWLTNIGTNNNSLILTKKYNPEDYPKYDNYDAINVDKVKDIPADYKGVMGVPITFLNSYNPKDFEIIKFEMGDDDKLVRFGDRIPYSRILIKHKQQ